jgi:hypothetical protein
MSSPDFATIFGFVLFAVSEVVAIIPIPANGILHSIVIGLKNSLKPAKRDLDIEMANVLVNSDKEMSNIVTTLKGNKSLTEAVNVLVQNPEISSIIGNLSHNTQLQYINTLLINNIDIISNVAKSVITEIQNKQIKKDKMTQEIEQFS